MKPPTNLRQNPVDALLAPPPHVTRRCGAHARSTGQPCRRWAAIGHHRCKLHGGAKGSGRPQIHGRRSEQTQRNQAVTGALMRLVRQRYRKLDPVFVPRPDDDHDTASVITATVDEERNRATPTAAVGPATSTAASLPVPSDP